MSATINACMIVVEVEVHVMMASGPTPTLTGLDGKAMRFRDAAEFNAYALGMAARGGQATRVKRPVQIQQTGR